MSLSWFFFFWHSSRSSASDSTFRSTFRQALLSGSPLWRHFATLSRITVGSRIVGRSVGRSVGSSDGPSPVTDRSSSIDRLV